MLLAYVGKAHVAIPGAVAQDSTERWVDKLLKHVVEKLFDQALQTSPLYDADIDDTTVGKFVNVAVPNPSLSTVSAFQDSPSRSLALSFLQGEWSRSASAVVARGLSSPVKMFFQSHELAHEKIGIKSKHTPPFDPTIVGTYSYHGIDGQGSEGQMLVKTNQDRGCIVHNFGGNAEQALFAVYDGHGNRGELISQYAMKVVQDSLEKHPGLVGDEVAAFEDVFITADHQLHDKKSWDPRFSGTTALVVLMRGSQVWVANAGDSRAVLASKNAGNSTHTSETAMSGVKTKELSRDQNVDTPGERERIEQSGGYVTLPSVPGGLARAWLNHPSSQAKEQVAVAMSRSIGDHAVKEIGVIASPEVNLFDLSSDDLFLIIATDGIWTFISSQEAIEIVWGALQSGKGATEAARILIETASTRWLEVERDYRDDCTAIVVTLPCFTHAA